ncbi:immune inhibitor A [bacterium]|nr:immune inhibitor A [bacterium]
MTNQNEPATRKPNRTTLIIILVILACLLVAAILLIAGASLGLAPIRDMFSSVSATPTLTQAPTQTASPMPTLTPTLAPTPTPSAGSQTWQTLREAAVPINNPSDLSQRLSGTGEIPLTYPDPNQPYALGAYKEFWVTNVDSNDSFKVSTRLRYLGENTYIWIENGVEYRESDLQKLGDTFDQEIYHRDREFFGSEWSPGVDDDPRIHIVYAGGLGYSLAGYFSSADELHPDAHKYSNAHEMFLINSDNVELWEHYVYTTLAHEFQHMIHWYRDKNEETWLNEGFSMLAELINDYNPGNFDDRYISSPDMQLTDWGGAVGSNTSHYGASLLFTTYFLGRFGEDTTKAVVAHPSNGMESIDLVMTELGITDPLTGEIITADDVFGDWAVANLLGDEAVGDGRYEYPLYPGAPTADPSPVISSCSGNPYNSKVSQFGVDYIQINCSGDYTLDFSGSGSVAILPTDPASGDYFFWSNMGDESDMSLSRQFDLTEISEPVEMTYETWFDLEEDYDYVYVSASTDGQNWDILNSTSCTTEDPSGNSYGCGLNGQTEGWQTEAVDLSPYAGQTVTVRFDYVTDAAVNGLGMAIDDIRVDALDYVTDFEVDDGGWEAAGFVRIQNVLDQDFRVSLVSYGEETTVTTLTLDDENRASVDLTLGEGIDSVVVVISGTTGFTRQPAKYTLEILPPAE